MPDYEDGYGEAGLDLCRHGRERDGCDQCGREMMNLAHRRARMLRKEKRKCQEKRKGDASGPSSSGLSASSGRLSSSSPSEDADPS